MKNLLISLYVALIGCAPPAPFIGSFVTMPSEIAPYYNDFITLISKDTGVKNKESNGSIVFNSLSNPRFIAVCTLKKSTFEPWIISVSPEHWKSLNEFDKRMVIFHELTHCLFRSSLHSPDRRSYMYAYNTAVLTNEELDEQVLEYTKDL